MTRRSGGDMTGVPLKMDEAAARLGVSRRWLQDFLKGRDIPYLAVGNRKMFDEHALTAIAEHMRTPNNPRAAKKAIKSRESLQDALALARAGKRDRDGFVYFIQCGDRIKIGFALNDVQMRLQTLQTGSPEPLVLLHYEAGSERIERELHRRFKAFRHAREWFRLEGALAEFIEGRRS